MVILGLAGSYALVKTRARQLESPEMKLFLWSFGVRVAAAIVIYQFGVVDILGDEDSSGWFAGVLLKREWEQRGLGAFDLPWIVSTMFDGTQVGYKYLLGILFHFTGSEGRMPAAVLNCFFGAMTVVMAYRVARSLFSEWVAVRTGWFACFFPSLIVWSAQTVKEPVVILLEIIALYCCIQLKTRTFHFKYIAWCAASILLIVPFRFYAAYIAAAAVVLTLSIPKLSKMKLTWGSVVAIGVLVVPIIMLSGVLARHEAQFEAFNIQRVQGFRRAISSGEGGGSGVASNYNLNNPVEMAQAIAVGGAHLLLAPFPWQLSMREHAPGWHDSGADRVVVVILLRVHSRIVVRPAAPVQRYSANALLPSRHGTALQPDVRQRRTGLQASCAVTSIAAGVRGCWFGTA